MSTLLERMGGASAVMDALDGLSRRMVADETLAPFFAGVDAQVWTEKLYDFLGRTLEASEYDAVSLRRSHQRLVDAGLGDAHFDLTLEYLREALAEVGVTDDCVEEVIPLFESTRNDVLCK